MVRNPKWNRESDERYLITLVTEELRLIGRSDRVEGTEELRQRQEKGGREGGIKERKAGNERKRSHMIPGIIVPNLE